MSKPTTKPSPSEQSQRCPINYAMDMFGDRWSLLLIRDMLVRGKRRYSEFLHSEEGISTNILASRLKQMQERGLLDKFPDPNDRKASIYLLTEKGLALAPVLLEVIRWGIAHDEYSAVPERISQALADPGVNLLHDAMESTRSMRTALQD